MAEFFRSNYTTFAFFTWLALLPQNCLAQDSLVDQQRDLVDIYRERFHPRGKLLSYNRKKVTIAIIPLPASGDGNGAIFTSFVTSFYAGNPDSTNLSVIYFAPYFTFSQQVVYPIRLFAYSANNTFNFNGDYRYMIYPQQAFKLGGGKNDEAQSLIYYKQYRFHQLVSKELIKNFYLGGGIQFDHYYDIQEQKFESDSSDYSIYEKESRSTFSSNGLAFQAMYDSRTNLVNSEKGIFSRTVFRYNPTSLGSTYEWSSLYTEWRQFISLGASKRQVLALWGLYWTKLGGTPYFMDLPSIGWDIRENTGRGILRNRYRSNALLYFESEYRINLTANGLWGAVLFANVNSASNYGTQTFQYWNAAVGSGLRLKWNKYSGNNFTFDVALSRNYWSWYFGVAENF